MKENVKRKIESYRNGDDKRPLIVDVSTLESLRDLLQNYYSIQKTNILDLTKVEAELLQLADLHEYMGNCKEDVIILTGLGTYLKLLGQNELNRVVHSLLNTSYSTKFIIITYQCFKYFNENSPKLRDKIIQYEETDSYSIPSSIIFVPIDYKNILRTEEGLIKALKRIENTEGEIIYVTTIYTIDNFKNSLIKINECKSYYDIICLKDFSLKKVQENIGTNEQWSKLLNNLQNNSVEDTIKEYINHKQIVDCVKNWSNMNLFEKWLLFLYLKLNNITTNNWSINLSISNSRTVDKFIENIYFSLDFIDYKEVGFWNKYQDWKEITKEILDDSIVFSYCKYIQYKNENALYYLTDNTDHEKKVILQILNRYKDTFTKKKLMDVLQHVYHDLYLYLCDYNLGNKLLNEYFGDYKLLKVTNNLTNEFKNFVDKEAVDRSFKKLLRCRAEILNEIDYKDSQVYFIDALGAEFAGFIERMCHDLELACRMEIGRANLPSTTENNTEFREFFKLKNIDVLDEKRLDELKHSGKNDFDFEKNKLPLYMVEEFRIIKECLINIKKKIKSQLIKKAIIVSDHGATRLAILNNDIVREDLESVGEHGGRICKVVENMKRIPNATIENGNCVLADYNVFKGGRIGKVEMHGGATLEEVAVPIVEIYDKDITINIRVITKTIKVSYKKNAMLYFCSSKNLKEVFVHINGKMYKTQTNDGFNFEVELDDIKKTGEYKFDVWSKNELVSSDNIFNIEKESATSVDLWG